MKAKKRYTMKDVKKLFGPDYSMPTDEEMLAAKPLELHEILTELKQRTSSPGKKLNSTNELAKVRRELQKLLGRLEKIEKNLIAH